MYVTKWIDIISKYSCALYRSTECPNGNWTRFNNNCYQLNNQELKWMNAKSECKKTFNSTLVSIRSKNEMDFLEQNILNGTNENIWIGISERNGDWYWEDGFKFGEFTNWAANEPNDPQINQTPRCVYLKEISHKWGDTYCSDFDFRFICMY